MEVFHIATATDWVAARRSGAYTTSTRGVTLEEEGFIHAARRDQVPGVWRRYYVNAGEPLVLLTIDTDRLTSPWQEDPVGSDTYPHVYGAINASAVVRVQPLDARGATDAVMVTFVRDMGARFALVLVAMALAVVGSLLGARLGHDWGEFAGAIAGLVVGVVLMGVLLRRK